MAPFPPPEAVQGTMLVQGSPPRGVKEESGIIKMGAERGPREGGGERNRSKSDMFGCRRDRGEANTVIRGFGHERQK